MSNTQLRLQQASSILAILGVLYWFDSRCLAGAGAGVIGTLRFNLVKALLKSCPLH